MRILICPSSTRRESAFALVLTLALIVLITFTVVAYFSRATTNRRIDKASTSAVGADVLARTASEIILSDLKTEVIAGSMITQPTSQQMPIYSPIDAQKMVPARVLAQSAMLGDTTFNNLAKQSIGRFFPTSGGYTLTPLIVSSTGRDTSIVSANNKVVSLARWNAPVLNTGAGFTGSGQLPQWVLLNRQGISTSQSWDATFRDYTPGNDNAIIGRFAFNVYDTGGLLDASVAGNPIYSPVLTNLQIQQLKSTQTGAYLDSIIPGFDTAKQTLFVNTWRFKSNSSGNFFADFMSTIPTFADSGFMRPTVRGGTSNSMPFSRQDLIRATIAALGGIPGNSYLTAASLAYFTHFSRELNAPSWTPITPAGSTIDYAGQAEQATATNRDIPNVRVKAAFTRADGTAAIVGEPLLKNRFPLRRLDGVGYNGANTVGFPVMVAGALQSPSATTIQRDFGLLWNSASNRWDYVGATGTTVLSSISTQDRVATGNREPNFFEILKAFILSGSIGLGSDNTGAGRTIVDAEPRFYQQPLSNDAQIIQIGANIIDQSDADKNPTFIFFDTSEYAGVENIPYLNKLIFQPQWTSNVAFSAWLMPSFWTAAQNSTAVGTQSATIPAIRFVMTGGTASAVVEGGASSASSAVVTGSASQPLLQLVSSAIWSPPNTPSTSSIPNSGVTPPNAPNGKLGVPFIFSSLGVVTKANTTRTYQKLSNATFEMQAQIGGVSGPWKTYQRWTNCTINISSVTSAYDTYAGVNWALASNYDPEYVLLDPRTMRFGVWETHASGTGDTSDYTRGYNEALEKSAGVYQAITGFGPQGSHFSGVGAQMANNTTASPGYTDLDGIRRQGDMLSSGATSAMLATTATDRPPILSRPIRTVAELGTVFRGQPWKTLNFTTADSGDAGLLDAFTIFEPNSVFRSDIVAGKLSLNTRQPLVLEAVLAGVATNTNNGTPLITPTQRSAIASALVAMTSAQPMINKSELVTRLAADPSVTGLGNKEAREAVIRALSDVGQTRTWNLMMDVIAQSGKYGAQASTVDDFIVEGEKRYWLHVAIDRYTGEVIDQQLEKINE